MGCSGSKTRVETATVEPEPEEAESTTAALKRSNSEKVHEDIRDKYDLGEILGSGSYGQVRQAVLKENPAEVRAVKMLDPDKGNGEWSNQAIFVREVALLQQIQHENIVRYYDFYEDIHFLYVVMEFCKGGEVFAKIIEVKRFSEKNAAHIGQQMLRGLDCIHKLNIAHRDIKAENFMLSDVSIHSNVKMIDFGMATKFEPDQTFTELCGSPHYLAPELIGQKYNHLADIWAFGVLLYLLMYGHYPYDASHPRDIMVKILTAPIKWTSKAKLSHGAIKFLEGLLEHDIQKRFTAAAALENSWINKLTAAGSAEGELLSDVVRSAHKKVTGTKKALDPQMEKLRNQRLQKIEEDFKSGIRHGKRLGPTPSEEYMSKPEFVRRENKITSAPSQQVRDVARSESFLKLVERSGKRSGSTAGLDPNMILEPIQPLAPLRQPKLEEPPSPTSPTLAPLAEDAEVVPEDELCENEDEVGELASTRFLTPANVGSGAKPPAASDSTVSVPANVQQLCPPGVMISTVKSPKSSSTVTSSASIMSQSRRFSIQGITALDQTNLQLLFKEKKDAQTLSRMGSMDPKSLSGILPSSEAPPFGSGLAGLAEKLGMSPAPSRQSSSEADQGNADG